ncbi:methyltransferase family protein [Candidatus Berkiella aquae]|uniref:DUF1295 domain-containing protein n=1 Tax=Candidatus Berkiella aquae TaxID=295108 RepID=A0A0Q9YVV0_9GAMM|nr:isoprenylcysteine carboxylmethyltransferase family protein [Candidatus Berkiella aquae]MCS5711570.1 DUF1295 domain-containing protein [Candidatus Berkiella aquae]
MNNNKSLPSVNNQWINLLGLCSATITFYCCLKWYITPLVAVLSTLTAYTLPILLLEVLLLKTPYRESTGFSATWHNLSFERIFFKLVGLYATFAMLIFLYWLFPEYHKPFYKDYWSFLIKIAPWAFLISIPYVALVDAKMDDPFDSYWNLGRILCFNRPQSYQGLAQHSLGWIVKGYFLPLMYAELYSKSQTLSITSFSHIFSNINTFFMTGIVILFTIDVLIATVGYLFTLRLFDSHIRSTDSTFFGWFVCLICYEPFYNAILMLYIPKKINFLTGLNSIDHPLLQSIWCGCVLFMLFCYVLATLAFGLRFSNLTNRGIITQGVYRLTKHPAYVAKTIFWWIAFIPLASIAPNPIILFTSILFLIGTTIIYYFRAKTEEKHLSKDPAYVEYGLWMNEHSIFAPLAKHWHFLRYQPPIY